MAGRGHPLSAGGGRATHAFAALLERAASGTVDAVLGALVDVPDAGPHPGRVAAARPLRRSGLPPQLQLAAQVAVAVGLASLVTLVDALSFRGACQAVTFVLVIVVMKSPSPHVGSRLAAIAAFPAPLALGSCLAGGAASAAAAASGGGAQPAFSVVLGVLLSAVLAAAAAVRVRQSPPYAVGQGLVIALGAGSTATAAAAAAAVTGAATHAHWGAVVGPTLLAGAAAMGAAAAASCVVLPTLASSAVETATAAALRGLGASLSATSARLFQAAPAPILPARAARALAPVPIAPHVFMVREPQEAAGFAEWWDRVCAPIDAPLDAGAPSGGTSTVAPAVLRRRLAAALASVTSRVRDGGSAAPSGGGGGAGDSGKPAAPPPPPPPSGPRLSQAAPGPPAAALRPLLAAARAGLAAAAAEPACLRGRAARAFDPAAWAHLLAALDKLLTRVAALDAAATLGGGALGPGAADAWSPGVAWHPSVRRAMRAALARAAAALACLSAQAGNGAGAGPPLAPLCRDAAGWRGGWAAAERDLRRGLRAQIEAYVDAVRAAANGGGGGGRGRVDVSELSYDVPPPDDAPSRGPSPSPASTDILLPSAFNARVRFYTFSLAVAVVEAMEAVDAAATAALCPAAARAPPATAWVQRLAGVSVCAPAWEPLGAWAASLWRRLQRRRGGDRDRDDDEATAAPVAASPAAAAASARTVARVHVAGIKYWGVVSSALAGTLALIAAVPALAALVPMYGFVAAALSMSEKVEATAVKVGSWLVASCVGGVLGAALLARGVLPSHPALLGVAVAVLAGACALAGTTRWRLVVTLAPLTLASVALCQFSVACKHAAPALSPADCSTTGTIAVAATRVVSVLVGVAFAQTVCVAVAPWFTSDWALDSLASTLREGAAPFMRQQYALFVEGSRAAAAAAGRTDDEAVVASVRRGDKSSSTTMARAGGGLSPAASLASALSSVWGSVVGRPPAPAADAAAIALTDDPEAGPPPPVLFPLPPPAATLSLQRAVADELVEVQASLARDATAWRRGVLATPPSVTSTLLSSLALLDALAALQLAARTPSPAGGTPSGALYTAYVAPTALATARVFDRLTDAADAAAAHLETVAATRHGAPWPGARARARAARAATRAALTKKLDALVAARLASIGAQAAARRAYMEAMAATPADDAAAAAAFVCPDDTVRHLAFMCALITASNRFVGVCRAALAA